MNAHTKPKTPAQIFAWCAANNCKVIDFEAAWSARLEMLKGFDHAHYDVPRKLAKRWGVHKARSFGHYGTRPKAANVGHKHYNWERV